MPPFHADPRARLVVLRIVTSPVEFGEEQFELHVPAQALLVERDDMAAPAWEAWRADTQVTQPRRLPYLPQARMIAYGMRVVSHPPDWDEGVLHVDSYPPPPPRRRASAESGGRGTRQGIPLPDDESQEKTNFLSVLCEDGLLCYKVNAPFQRQAERGALTLNPPSQLDPSQTWISHAYWFTP